MKSVSHIILFPQTEQRKKDITHMVLAATDGEVKVTWDHTLRDVDLVDTLVLHAELPDTYNDSDMFRMGMLLGNLTKPNR